MGQKSDLLVLGGNATISRNLRESFDVYGMTLWTEETTDAPFIVAYGDEAVAVARLNYALRYPEHIQTDTVEAWELEAQQMLGCEHLITLHRLGMDYFVPATMSCETVRFMEMH